MSRRAIATLCVVTAVGTAPLAGCALPAGSTLQESRTLPEAIRSVRLDISSGRATLRGGDATTTTVARTVRYQDGAVPDGTTYAVENGVLVLRGCGDRCSVDYTVDLPANLPVTGVSTAGAVSLLHVGAVDVETSAGAVDLDGVAGPVAVRTANGRISGRGLAGPGVRTETTNGAIDLRLDAPVDVEAKTSNGAITVDVAPGSYRVSARTDNGRVEIGIPNDPAGSNALDLTSDNGRITVVD